MNNKLYGKLIFELSHKGRIGYSLSENEYEGFSTADIPDYLRRAEDAALPECDEMTVVRHYTNHSANNFGVNNGFYPLGSCTMKYNPVINEEVAALQQACIEQGFLAGVKVGSNTLMFAVTEKRTIFEIDKLLETIQDVIKTQKGGKR